MNRSETRQVAFELLYSLEIQKVPAAEYKEQIELFLNNQEIKDHKVEEYIQDVVNGIHQNMTEIMELIKKELSAKWELNRISKINLAILKLAVYELLYKKLPYKVVVNEAVELAKSYGDESASSFINGVLASIIQEKGIQTTAK